MIKSNHGGGVYFHPASVRNNSQGRKEKPAETDLLHFPRRQMLMKFKRTGKLYGAIALIMAVSMLTAGCSADDSESGEGTSVSINVIGGNSDNGGNGDSSSGDSPAEGTGTVFSDPQQEYYEELPEWENDFHENE